MYCWAMYSPPALVPPSAGVQSSITTCPPSQRSTVMDVIGKAILFGVPPASHTTSFIDASGLSRPIVSPPVSLRRCASLDRLIAISSMTPAQDFPSSPML